MEYIGNLKNCPVYQREDGTICADLRDTSVKANAAKPKSNHLTN